MYCDLVKNKAIVHYKFFLRSLRRVAAIYKIGKSTLARWLSKEKIIVSRTKKESVVKKIATFIESKLLENPFLTTFEMSKLVQKELNQKTSQTSCWRALRYTNFSRKRTRNQIIKSNKPLIVNEFKTNYLASKNLVSIDETFFYYDVPRYGYSKKGTQLRKQSSENPKKHKITLYMAISENKVIGYKISRTHGTATDFLEFLKSLNLKESTLLMDNVAFHKTRAVKEYIASIKSNILFTPPYSPEFNPIELAFSKIKTIYRKSCLDDNLSQLERVKVSINSISSYDTQNFFKHVSEKI